MAGACFTRSQTIQFYNHIKLPIELHESPPSLSLLKTLHVYMISACPYENLSIHYNHLHRILLDPQHLFKKIVHDSRGRGGYCMELALFYNHMLRSIGFDSYTAGARTRSRVDGVPHGDYPGWIHIVSIVTFAPQRPGGEEQKYHVDIAFGGDGSVAPLPLISGNVHRNLGEQQVRLLRDWIPTQTHRVEQSKLWIYQYRNSTDAEWNSFYAFPECEFMAADWEVVNWWAGSSKRSWQTHTMLIVRFLRAEERGSGDISRDIYGKRMLVNNVVKENLGGKTKVLKVCQTEAERIEVLKEFFGIQLTDAEKEGIREWITCLDSKH